MYTRFLGDRTVRPSTEILGEVIEILDAAYLHAFPREMKDVPNKNFFLILSRTKGARPEDVEDFQNALKEYYFAVKVRVVAAEEAVKQDPSRSPADKALWAQVLAKLTFFLACSKVPFSAVPWMPLPSFEVICDIISRLKLCKDAIAEVSLWFLS